MNFEYKYLKYKTKYLNMFEYSDSNVMKIQSQLKYMSGAECMHIYSILENDIEKLYYKIIFIFSLRPIIFVTKIKIKDTIIHINMPFYKSTGTSRDVDSSIKNLWFPTTGMEVQSFDFTKLGLMKLEDIYISDDKNITSANIPDLITYSRFINKNNALISKYLYEKFPKDILFPNKTVAEIVKDTGYQGSYNYDKYILEPEFEI